VSGVRARFAPSPTGHLHLGGARTALFNWLFARHEGGSFILRIEDTDLARSERHLEDELVADLAWLGLTWDEGPNHGGGSGPYRQSERVAVYRAEAERLLAEGKAYPCFCADEELARKRQERLAAGLAPRYDGACRSLGEAERDRERAAGRPESIRFHVGDHAERRLVDVVRGEVSFPAGMVGDFVVLRSNGLPVYNFAAVVDDARMGITHVIRGEEHLSNTLRQLLLYEAMNLPVPVFAHLPLILGADRSKLSKRHGAPNVSDFRERGYPAEAIVNYLAFLGWSPPGGGEILGVEDLIRDFTLERVSPSPGIFDEAKLDWVAASHIRRGGAARYFEEAQEYFPPELRAAYPRERLKEIFDIAAENLPCFSRLTEASSAFRPGVPQIAGEALDAARGAGALFAAAAESFAAAGEWKAPAIAAALQALGTRTGRKGRSLYMPLRAALTGSLHGPDLSRVMEIRGRDDVLACLRDAASRNGDPV
jgi:nondiscriminating glutamyl-tRNA synthetase